MKNFLERFSNIYENTNSRLERYLTALRSNSNDEIKSLSATHYTFLTDMLDLINAIDTLSSDAATAMIAADASNDAQKIKALDELFEKCACYRQNLQEYFDYTQSILKQGGSNTAILLRQKTDELIRKIFMLKF